MNPVLPQAAAPAAGAAALANSLLLDRTTSARVFAAQIVAMPLSFSPGFGGLFEIVSVPQTFGFGGIFEIVSVPQMLLHVSISADDQASDAFTTAVISFTPTNTTGAYCRYNCLPRHTCRLFQRRRPSHFCRFTHRIWRQCPCLCRCYPHCHLLSPVCLSPGPRHVRAFENRSHKPQAASATLSIRNPPAPPAAIDF